MKVHASGLDRESMKLGMCGMCGTCGTGGTCGMCGISYRRSRQISHDVVRQDRREKASVFLGLAKREREREREPSASLVKRAVASWSHPCMFWLEMFCHICVVIFGVAQTTSSVVGLNLIPFHTRV